MKKKWIAFLLTAVMMIPAVPMTAFAVTGSDVAADGTYSGSGSNVGTIKITVSDGKITGLTCSKANKSKYKTLVNTWLKAISGKTASYDTIDAVSAATSGKYGSGLKSGTLAALKTAPAAGSSSSSDGSDSGSSSGSSSGSTSGAVADGTYSGEGSNVGTITVTVSSGVIAGLTCSKATKSSYQSLVTNWLNKIKGLTASYDTIDAVSAATSGKYGTGLKQGTLAALSSASGSSSGSGSDSSTTEEDTSEIGQGIGSKTGTKYTGTGTIDEEYVTLDVYVSGGVIAGVFIAAEEGSWLSLLTSMSDTFLGLEATSTAVDAITSSTSLGFRDTLRNAVSNALASAGGSDSSADESTSEIGQGIGSKTGTKYTGSATLDSDHSITLDVYVKYSKITGVFIAAEKGTWLSLLQAKESTLIGASAASQTIDAISSATIYSPVIYQAVSDALSSISDSGSSSTGTYKADGWDKEYSYNTLKNKQYYYYYKNVYYPIIPVYDRSMSKDKPYAAYIQVNGVKYYLDEADEHTGSLPTKWNGAKSATKKIYESAEADDDADDKREEPQLYTLS